MISLFLIVSDKYIQLLIELSLTVKCMRLLESRRRENAVFHFKFAGWTGVSANPDCGQNAADWRDGQPPEVKTLDYHERAAERFAPLLSGGPIVSQFDAGASQWRFA